MRARCQPESLRWCVSAPLARALFLLDRNAAVNRIERYFRAARANLSGERMAVYFGQLDLLVDVHAAIDRVGVDARAGSFGQRDDGAAVYGVKLHALNALE